MFNIKWIGFIEEKDISKYQTSKLPKNIKEVKMSKSLKGIKVKSIPFMVVAVVIMYLALMLKKMSGGGFIGPFVFVGLFIGVLLCFIHEFLHAIVYPYKAKKYIGIVKPLTFVALASHPMKRNRFLLMCLIPYILGIIPLVLFFVLPNNAAVLSTILWGTAFIGFVSPSADAYNAVQVIKQVPRNKKVILYKDRLFYFL